MNNSTSAFSSQSKKNIECFLKKPEPLFPIDYSSEDEAAYGAFVLYIIALVYILSKNKNNQVIKLK